MDRMNRLTPGNPDRFPSIGRAIWSLLRSMLHHSFACEDRKMLGRVLSFVTAVAIISQGELGAQTPTNVDDLRNWQTLGLPLAAEWNVTGYGLQYHVDQARAGHR